MKTTFHKGNRVKEDEGPLPVHPLHHPHDHLPQAHLRQKRGKEEKEGKRSERERKRKREKVMPTQRKTISK